MDEGYGFYITMIVIVIIAIQFFRGGHIMLSFATLAVGAWLAYTKDNPVDISETIYESIDEGAKSEYNKKGMGTSVYDGNLSRVK
jgi:hypothetical protein